MPLSLAPVSVHTMIVFEPNYLTVLANSEPGIILILDKRGLKLVKLILCGFHVGFFLPGLQ